jgi:MoaA/NifB/PqqE/SkfB family radical SAM enzyme
MTGPTGDAYRVLQVHVSRRCNLECLHCYSSSGPRFRDELTEEMLCSAVTDAAAEGYNVVGISGGEPLMYRPLRQVLLHARALGLITTVTTNGMLLDRRRIASLTGAANLLAISLDGVPASHNAMRGNPRAFEIMAKNLPALREAGIPFGFIFTLTQHNLNELVWVADFALREGAKLLQIHPLEGVGRAQDSLGDAIPDGTELSYAVLAVARIQELVGDQMKIQLDVAGREAIAEDPDRVFAGQSGYQPAATLAEILSPLIIETNGDVVPVEYAFGGNLALGNLRDASLRELAGRWKVEKLPLFLQLCRQVHAAVTTGAKPDVVNWYELIARQAAANISVYSTDAAPSSR